MTVTVDVPGHQLDSQELHQRQKSFRADSASWPGPTVVAVGLQIAENIGSVLRVADAAGSPQVIFVNDETVTDSHKRIHKTARNCDVLVQWELCSSSEFLFKADTLRPLLALELTTASVNLFEAPLPNSCA